MISLIAAIGKNNEIGKDNELLWHLKEDMIYFKNTTINHKVVMGRKTFESIKKPLPNRENIIISKTISKIDNITILNNSEDILKLYLNSDEEIFIIGGASLYNFFIKYASKIYLTEINDEKEADAYFPSFNKENYERKLIKKNIGNPNFNFVIYERKKNER